LKRTPKNYDGIESPDKEIKNVLPSLLKNISKRWEPDSKVVFQGWYRLIGKELASYTKPVHFEDGVLTIKVKSSTLYSLLHQREKPRLLRELSEHLPKAKIRDLVFRIG